MELGISTCRPTIRFCISSLLFPPFEYPMRLLIYRAPGVSLLFFSPATLQYRLCLFIYFYYTRACVCVALRRNALQTRAISFVRDYTYGRMERGRLLNSCFYPPSWSVNRTVTDGGHTKCSTLFASAKVNWLWRLAWVERLACGPSRERSSRERHFAADWSVGLVWSLNGVMDTADSVWKDEDGLIGLLDDDNHLDLTFVNQRMKVTFFLLLLLSPRLCSLSVI